jgi:uncharacterized SAM-binding protein YcdF (DUF218 family)
MNTLKRPLEFCLSPMGIVTILLAAGLAGSLRRRWSRGGRRLVFGGATLFLVFLLTPLAEILVASLERPFPALLGTEKPAGLGAVVPAGGVPGSAGARATAKPAPVVVLAGYGRDFPLLPVTSDLTAETIARIAEGIRVYRSLPGSRLVMSGGVSRAGDPPVAKMMADFAAAMGVPETALVVEGRSTTTYENMVEVKKIVGVEPFLLVTSADSMARATAVARKLGMRAVPAPAAVWAAQDYRAGMSWSGWVWAVVTDTGTPSVNRLGYLQRAYHEYLGLAWYRVLGRVLRGFGPRASGFGRASGSRLRPQRPVSATAKAGEVTSPPSESAPRRCLGRGEPRRPSTMLGATLSLSKVEPRRT